MKTNVLQYAELGAWTNSPDATAIEFLDQSCSFRELQSRSLQVAAAICRCSTAVNKPVCVYLPRGIETIAADLGILASRNCYSNLDVRSPLPRTLAILKNLAPHVIITSKNLAESLLALQIPSSSLLFIEDCLNSEATTDDIAE
ncbi:MAG: hypothetical protein RLZZ458_326, partial [Planctomycetota bacterium]